MSLDINNNVSYENPWTFDNKPLIVMILGITSGLFISLPISPTHDVTLVESIFGRSENRQVKKEK